MYTSVTHTYMYIHIYIYIYIYIFNPMDSVCSIVRSMCEIGKKTQQPRTIPTNNL